MNRSRITGDLTASGLLYADIANDRVGIGSTIPGNKLSLPDSAKIGLGNAEDLTLYHDSGHSYIEDTGTGNLLIKSDSVISIRGTTVAIKSADNSQTLIKGVENAGSELYFNNNLKLTTSNTGIDVTGAITADDLRTDNSQTFYLTTANDFRFRHTGGTERLRITSDGNTGIGTNNPATILHLQSVNPTIRLTDSNQAADNKNWNITGGQTQILRFQAINDAGSGGGNLFDFYRVGNQIREFRGVNSGSTWFVVDNLNKKVGIGEDAPQQKLHLHEESSNGNFMVFTNSTTGATGNDGCLFGINSDEGGTIWNQENGYIRFGTNDKERLKITSAGVIQTPGTTKIKPHSVGIGTTSITNTGVGTAYGEMMYNTTTNNVQVYTTTTGWYNVSDLQGYYKTAAAASSDGMNHYWGGSSSTSIISGLTPNGSPGGSPNTPTLNHTAQSYYGDYPYFDFASGNDQVGYEFTKSGTAWGTGPFTICFWVDVQGVTMESESTYVQLGNHSGSRSLYSVSVDADRKLKAITIGDDTGVSTDAQLIGNTWQHVAVTYNTSRVTKYYINGSLVRSHTHNSAMQIGHNTQHIYLGYGYWNAGAGNKAAIAHMSDIGIWDAKELNATEIKNIYNAKRIIRGY